MMPLIIVCTLSLVIFSPVHGSDFIKYQGLPHSSSIFCDPPELPVSLKFLYDSCDLGYLFVAVDKESADDLLLYTHDGSEFQDPVLLHTHPDGIRGMAIAIGSDDTFHIVWVDRKKSWDEARLWYMTVKDNIPGLPVMLETNGYPTWYPMLDVDSSNDVHVVFSSDMKSLIYIRTLNHQFQPLSKLDIDTDGRYMELDLAVGKNGNVLFVCNDNPGLWLVEHDGQHFSEPILVEDILASPKQPWVISDFEGNFHLFYMSSTSRASGLKVGQFFHRACSSSLELGEPEQINHDSGSYLWPEPVIDHDGIIHVLTYMSEVDDEWGTIYYGYLYHNNGYGFGNAEIVTPPCYGAISIFNRFGFDIRSDGRLGLYMYSNINGYGQADLYLAQFERKYFQEPVVYTNVTRAGRFVYLDYRDNIFVDLSIYNPTQDTIVVDLISMLYVEFRYTPEYPYRPDVYLFLTDQPTYPDFTEEPYYFHLFLKPGDSYQHIPLYEIDMSPLSKPGEVYFYSWIVTVLLDPDTKAVIGRYYSVGFIFE